MPNYTLLYPTIDAAELPRHLDFTKIVPVITPQDYELSHPGFVKMATGTLSVDHDEKTICIRSGDTQVSPQDTFIIRSFLNKLTVVELPNPETHEASLDDHVQSITDAFQTGFGAQPYLTGHPFPPKSLQARAFKRGVDAGGMNATKTPIPSPLYKPYKAFLQGSDGKPGVSGPGNGFGYDAGTLWPECRFSSKKDAEAAAILCNEAFSKGGDNAIHRIHKVLRIPSN